MKILKTIQELISKSKSSQELQNEISVNEVWYLWDVLTARYDVIRTTQLLKSFAKDKDLNLILEDGLKELTNDINRIENLMKKYGATMPNKKPIEDIPITKNVEKITDKYIFRRVFRGIQNFIPIEGKAFTGSGNAEIRSFFKDMLIKELKLYDRLYEYGKMKSWTIKPPKYRNN
ncbi:DUF3231 family protein [Sporohalobacter salinus]|uniref:DUF3231 family protein n=1 Tax=Sporohalobacter salinus TaxID=1494606 RepID=UPI00195F860B|nr:DUF3231 family protein [Sporohalobacter salinus]MBM7622694.1 hypothetical protein [Sporohalobacter salinus]